MILKKIKEDVNYYKNNKKELLYIIIPIIIAIIMVIPVPYVYSVGGGIIKIDKNIHVQDEYKSEGSLNCAYVSEVNGNVFIYLISKVAGFNSYKKENLTLDNETLKEYSYRERLYFENSIDNAIFVAYNKAGKKIDIKNTKYYVLYVDPSAQTELKTNDEILEVEGAAIEDLSYIKSLIEEKEDVKIKVLRDGKEIETISRVQTVNNKKVLGVYLTEKYDYKLEKAIDMEFTSKEAGPSGGLMLALSIYNKLVEEDITKGKKLVGTGTIDKDGNVEEISGIKYKLKGAVKNDADVFIVPKENYDEALRVKKKNKYDIKIISVSSFDEALEKLKNL